ncbi:MAG: phosphoglycerate mutase (2,3-diphosphoglycerate-independent) [Enterocloster asparagiformis]|nr:phosphoglycerate mutase (2,3-diphosphoglycerate-independent) [Enterocloster asparagiformis]
MSQPQYGGASLAEAVKGAYAKGMDDYHMEPLVLTEGGRPVGRIADGDSVIFCCRRGEREIELTDMFTDPGFDKFPCRRLKGLYFAIMTLYHEKFKDLPIAFAPSHVEKPLAQVLSQAGKSQLHCAESEKFAHVTFFLNGGENAPFPGETDLCIPSPKGIPFDQKPELALPEVADTVIGALGRYDFIVTNFANGDVIGHTLNSDAKITACGDVSRHLGRVVEAALGQDYVVAITADHGNIENLRTPDGRPDGAHTDNQVAFLLMDSRGGAPVALRDGALSDVAPTVLDVMGIEKPREMTGRSLACGHSFGDGRRALLIILDGWGIGDQTANDAIYSADTLFWDSLISGQPWSRLYASGEHVGLGPGKAGNSEAGHTNLGAGRLVLQDDVRLDAAVRDGSFQKNPVFLEAIDRCRRSGKALHLLSYLTHKSSHGSIDYPLSICEMAKDLPEVYLHIIFDGRSTQPGSAPELLRELDEKLGKIGGNFRVVDGVGRGLVLDRDQNWESVGRAYNAFVDGRDANQYEAV